MATDVFNTSSKACRGMGPGLKRVGLRGSVMLRIVDSRPMAQRPPSTMYSILSPRVLWTCCASVGLM